MVRQPTVQSNVAEKSPSTATLGAMRAFFMPQTDVNVGVIERLASLVVGATIVLIIARRFLLSCSLIGVGVYLFYRGATGYCPLYASEQIDTRQWRMELPSTLRHRYHGNQ